MWVTKYDRQSENRGHKPVWLLWDILLIIAVRWAVTGGRLHSHVIGLNTKADELLVSINASCMKVENLFLIALILKNSDGDNLIKWPLLSNRCSKRQAFCEVLHIGVLIVQYYTRKICCSDRLVSLRTDSSHVTVWTSKLLFYNTFHSSDYY